MLTNLTGLPDAIARAVANDPYDPGSSDITVTGLLKPPRQRALYLLHKADVVEDVADRVWALMGQSVHALLERAGQEIGEPVEERLYMTVEGWKVGGKFDSLRLDRVGFTQARLTDYKVTSAWTRLSGSRDEEWAGQLNMLAALCRANDRGPITSVSIVALYRDWSRAQVGSIPGSAYPEKMAEELEFDCWPQEQVIAYMGGLVRRHQLAQATAISGYLSALPLCTDEERWYNAKTKRFRRCESYCNVAPFCEQCRGSAV